jgi:hypothetical protein
VKKSFFGLSLVSNKHTHTLKRLNVLLLGAVEQNTAAIHASLVANTGEYVWRPPTALSMSVSLLIVQELVRMKVWSGRLAQGCGPLVKRLPCRTHSACSVRRYKLCCTLTGVAVTNSQEVSSRKDGVWRLLRMSRPGHTNSSRVQTVVRSSSDEAFRSDQCTCE